MPMTAVDQQTAAVDASPPHGPLPHSRTCLLVLGMHRSGTSALTRLLSLAGATLPRRLMPAGPGNESGHWEPQHLVDFHDRFLASIGSAWHDWTAVDLSKLAPESLAAIKTEMKAILREDYPDGDILAVKDPRICRFAQLFMSVAHELGWQVALVHAFRNPLDVVNSLNSRKVVWPPGYTTTEAALLWLRHVLDSEMACRGRPRALVSFDALMADPTATLAKIEAETGLKFPKTWSDIEPDARTFLSPAQRHHAYTPADLAANPDTGQWVMTAHDALCDAERDATDAMPLAKLETLAAEFDRACPALARLHAELRRQETSALTQKAIEIAGLQTELANLEQLRRRQEEEAAAKLAALQDLLETQRAEAHRQLTAAQSQFESQRLELLQRLSDVESQRDHKAEEIAQLLRQIADTHAMYTSSTSWRVTTPLRMVSRTPDTVKHAVRALPHALGVGPRK